MFYGRIYIEVLQPMEESMKQVDTTVARVVPGSIAEEAGIGPGDKIIRINDSDFRDILEYRYLVSDAEITVEVQKKSGETEIITIENNYEDLGVEFQTGLIDNAQSCRNKCIFCFIDQLPPNMRETVYFKDDDTRLSFLQGNYVTLTNMDDEAIDRMIAMRISPINISVHTTNPDLRVKMLKNKNAGKVYSIMQKFAQNHIYMNCQIVLCPGFNDGEELDRSISDMTALAPYVNSVSVVPVGLTRYREGLCPLTAFDARAAYDAVRQVQAWQDELLESIGTRLVYLADELYLMAKLPIPKPETYEGFPQIENGVGLIASMSEEFDAAIARLPESGKRRHVAMATGELAQPYISTLIGRMKEKLPNLTAELYPIKNDFFGGGVNVAGLVCGGDLIRQMKDKPKADVLFIPHVMLRDEDELFLDDVTVADVERELGMPVVAVYNDGYDFVEKVSGVELEF